MKEMHGNATDGGWPRDYPSEMFWRTHPPMTEDAATAAATRLWSFAFPDRTREGMPEVAGMRILDLGCGRGEIALAFGALGAQVVGIDYDERRIAEAESARRPGHGDVLFITEDVSSGIPLPQGFDAGFDLIFCHYTGWGYGGADSLRSTFAAVRDALAPGGTFVVESYDGDATISRFDMFLCYDKETDDGIWNIRCGADLTMPPHSGGIGRIDQEWNFTSPDGSTHGPYRVAFEPMTIEAISAIAACAGYPAPVALRTTPLDRSTPGTPRVMLRFVEPVALQSSEIAERMRHAWMHQDVAVTDGRTLTGRDMLDATARIEAALRQIPRIPGHHAIAVMVPRSWAWPALLAACRSADLAFVPVDPDLPDPRLRGILTRLRPLAVVSFREQAHRLADACYGGASAPLGVLPPGPGFEPLTIVPTGDPEPLPVDASHVVFTSGSTGMPKAVLLQEKGLLRVVDAQIALLPPPTGRFLWALNPSFDASFSDVLCAVLGGHTLHIHRGPLTRLKSLRDALRQADVADLPPSMLGLLSDEMQNLRGLVFGGERAPSHLVRLRAGTAYGFQAYGPTEGSVCAMAAAPTSEWTTGLLGRPLVPGTVGLLVGGRMHTLVEDLPNPNGVRLDPPVAGPVEGEIVLTGDIVALGYLKDEHLEAQRFAVIDGRRLHFTGDLARYADGHVVWIGRNDRQIKINGRLICPEEVERAVEDLLEGAAARAVVDQNRIHLYVQASAVPADIGSRIAERLGPAFRPASVNEVGSMPVTSNGKIDDDALLRGADA